MKKILLFVALIGCFMPMMAQRNVGKISPRLMKETKKKVEELNKKALSYTEKLDTLVYSYGNKMSLEYDQNLNCTKVKEYNIDETGWNLSYTTEYEYDAQNRVVSMLYTVVDYQYTTKMTMVYDGNGRIVEEHLYLQAFNGQWIESVRMTYDYDAQGNLKVISTLATDDYINWYETEREEYTYENGLVSFLVVYHSEDDIHELVYYSRSEWTYDAQQRCIQLDEFEWNDSDWELEMRTEYLYDSNGNLIQELYSGLTDDILEYYYMTEYEYDDHFNLIEVNEYDYSDNNWVFDEQVLIEYDLNVPASKIAGYTIVFEGSYTSYFKNKVLSMQMTNADNHIETVSYYYSSANELSEASELQCIVYPNPTNETLTVMGNDLSRVDIFSMDGKLVMRLENGLETINVSGLANGSYLLKATFTDGKTASQQFIKK